MTAGEAGYRLGYAAFPIVVLGIALYVGWRMGKKRQPPKFVIWPIAAAVILLGLGALGLQMKQQRETPPFYGEKL